MAAEVKRDRFVSLGLPSRCCCRLTLLRNGTILRENKFDREVNMNKWLRWGIVVLTLTTVCLAQEGLTVHTKGKQKWPAAEAEKIYLSACSAVQREFGSNRAIRPQVNIVLGADKDEVFFDEREVRLTKWDRHLFAQGVVVFAFEDLMPIEERWILAKRALNWADATVEIERAEK